VIVSVIVFLVLFSFVHFAFRSDARPVDGDLTVGFPLRYYTVTAGLFSPVQTFFNLTNFFFDAVVLLVFAVIVGFVFEKVKK